MARSLFWGSGITAFDTNGDPAPGAKMHFYATGTTTPVSVYAQAVGGSPLSNPVVADSAGRFVDMFLDVDVVYRVKLTNSAGSDTIFDVDPVTAGVSSAYATYAALADDSPSGASLIGTDQGDTVQEIIDGLYLGFFTDFAGTPPAIPLVQMRVQTSGYGSLGVGAAFYVYDGTVNAAYVLANPLVAFLDSLGRGWRLDPGQRFTLEMFGGYGDDDGSTGTDNYAALVAAESYAKFYPYISIPFSQYYGRAHPLYFENSGRGRYYVSQTYEPRSIVKIMGSGTGAPIQGTPASTTLVFPADTTCIRVCNQITTGTTTVAGPLNVAEGSEFNGIGIEQRSGSDRTKHGFHIRAQAIIRGCWIRVSAGTGIYINASTGAGGANEGSANGWVVEDVSIHLAGMHGMYITGSDANAGRCAGLEVHEVTTGAGVFDESGLGSNTYDGILINGYGNTGVTHAGKHWILVSNTNDGSAVTPGTNPNVWYDVGTGSVTAQYPTYSGGTSYKITRPFALFGASHRSVVTALYTEGGYSVIAGNVAIATGGQCAFVNGSPHFSNLSSGYGIFSKSGVGGRLQFEAGSAGAALMGENIYAAVGTPEDGGPETGLIPLKFGRDIDGFPWYWTWDQATGTHFLRYSPAGFKTFEITGPDASLVENFGRSTGVVKTFKLNTFALADENGSNGRIHSSGSAAPASGYHSRGEFVWNVAPSAAGTLGWSCVSSGTPGTWKAVTGISA